MGRVRLRRHPGSLRRGRSARIRRALSPTDAYPPPGVPSGVVNETERFESVAGIILATGFAGLIAGLTLAVEAEDHPVSQALIFGASFFSGLAALLAVYGLGSSYLTQEPSVVVRRRWVGGSLALSVMQVAAVLALLAAAPLL
jgi:hypothetical protein